MTDKEGSLPKRPSRKHKMPDHQAQAKEMLERHLHGEGIGDIADAIPVTKPTPGDSNYTEEDMLAGLEALGIKKIFRAGKLHDIKPDKEKPQSS